MARPDFRAVYTEHAQFVARCARHQRVLPHEVEDVMHDVFLVVHARLSDFDPDRATMRSWLYGISRRVISQRARGQRRALRRLSLVRSPQPGPSPHDALERAEAAELVARFVEQLDEKKRPVFTLAEIEGMSAPEIAQCLELNVNTVYSRLRLARGELRKFAGGEQNGGPHGTDQ